MFFTFNDVLFSCSSKESLNIYHYIACLSVNSDTVNMDMQVVCRLKLGTVSQTQEQESVFLTT